MKSSKVQWVEIGELISPIDKRNKDNCDYPVVGVNRTKDFMPTVANLDGIDLRKYKVISNGDFIFSGMQTGRDMCIRIGLYERDLPSLISPAYITFRISQVDKVLPDFFFMYFCRDEMDRFGAFCSDGSVRANLDWDRFIGLQIPLPSITEQQTIVDAWKSLRNIKEQNEALAAPLMQLCQSYIQECKHKYPKTSIGKYMTKGDKNANNSISRVLGVGQNGFMSPQKVPNESLRNYKIMDKDAICYAPPLYNIKSDAIHLYEYDEPAVCSPIYEVFHINSDVVLPHYLMLWLKREEFKRYAEFYALGVRNTFNYELMEQFSIPLPPIDVQRAIVSLYQCALEYKSIAAEADAQSRSICSALMQHAINS